MQILSHTYETNIMLYVNYTSIFKNIKRASLVAAMVKNPPSVQET